MEYTVGQKSKEISAKLVLTSLKISNCFSKQKPSSMSSKRIEKEPIPCSSNTLIFSFRSAVSAVLTGASPTPTLTEWSFEKSTKSRKAVSHSFVYSISMWDRRKGSSFGA